MKMYRHMQSHMVPSQSSLVARRKSSLCRSRFVHLRRVVNQPTMGRPTYEKIPLTQPDALEVEKGAPTLPAEAAAIRHKRHRRWSAVAFIALLCLAFHLFVCSDSTSRYHYRHRLHADRVSGSELRDWLQRMPQASAEEVFLDVPSNDSAFDALKRCVAPLPDSGWRRLKVNAAIRPMTIWPGPRATGGP
jgi:hypothetical protein